MTSKQEHRRRARLVADGYPFLGSFASKEEVDRYFSGSVIVCLLCGRPLQKLDTHLRKIHDESVGEYRERYGLPETRGLVSQSMHLRLSATIRADEKRMARIASLGRISRGKLAKGIPNRRVAEYRSAMSRERGLGAYGLKQPYGNSAKAAFLRLMGSGHLPSEICKMQDQPGKTTVDRWKQADPRFAAAYDEVIELMPFHAQARMGRLGKSFQVELRKLFVSGISDAKSARILGVSEFTCKKFTTPWRAARADVSHDGL